MNYQQKYLKYKFKYLNLLRGSGSNEMTFNIIDKSREFKNAGIFKDYIKDPWFSYQINSGNVFYKISKDDPYIPLLMSDSKIICLKKNKDLSTCIDRFIFPLTIQIKDDPYFSPQ